MPFDVVAFFGRKQERVRLLRRGEVIPSSLDTGFEALGQLDTDWIWCLDVDGAIKGVLLASPCHGAAIIWRIAIEPGQSSMALGRLLRAFMRDCAKRNVRGYLTIVSPAREEEKRLAAIITKAGGTIVKEGMTIMLGAVREDL
jgi:hypothetical protein